MIRKKDISKKIISFGIILAFVVISAFIPEGRATASTDTGFVGLPDESIYYYGRDLLSKCDNGENRVAAYDYAVAEGRKYRGGGSEYSMHFGTELTRAEGASVLDAVVFDHWNNRQSYNK